MYQKWFLLGSYITAGVDRMVERVQKHLSKDTKDTLLPLCREKLDQQIKSKVLGVLGALPK